MDTETKKHFKKVIIFVFLYVIAFSIGAFLLIPVFQPFGFIIWLFSALGSLFLFVRWHTKNTAYICPECGHRFTISTLRGFISPHMWRKKLLRCPECGKMKWCLVISAKQVVDKSP